MQRFRRLSEGMLATLDPEQRAEYDAAEKYDVEPNRSQRRKSTADWMRDVEQRLAALEAK